MDFFSSQIELAENCISMHFEVFQRIHQVVGAYLTFRLGLCLVFTQFSTLASCSAFVGLKAMPNDTGNGNEIGAFDFPGKEMSIKMSTVVSILILNVHGDFFLMHCVCKYR